MPSDQHLLIKGHERAINEQLLLQELEAEVRRNLMASPTPVSLMPGGGGDKSRAHSNRFMASRSCAQTHTQACARAYTHAHTHMLALTQRMHATPAGVSKPDSPICCYC